MKYVFILSDLNSEDEAPTLKVFSSAKLAAERLVSMIDGHGLMNEAGDELDMEDVIAWRAKDGDFEAWDGEGRVLFTLQRVQLDPK